MRALFAGSLALLLLGISVPAMAVVDSNNDGVQGPETSVPGTEHEGSVYLGGDTFAFPVEGVDTFSVVFFPYWWNAGDTGYGDRASGIGSVTEASINLSLDANFLSCDTDEFDLLINGVVAGHFSILPGENPVVRSFGPFAAIPAVAGEYEIRIRVTETVLGGCGSVDINTVGGSSVEISGGPIATEATTWTSIKSLYR